MQPARMVKGKKTKEKERKIRQSKQVKKIRHNSPLLKRSSTKLLRDGTKLHRTRDTIENKVTLAEILKSQTALSMNTPLYQMGKSR